MTTEEEYLTAQEVAAILKVSRVHVWRLAREGKLARPVKFSERVSRFTKSSVNAFLEGKRLEAAQATAKIALNGGSNEQG